MVITKLAFLFIYAISMSRLLRTYILLIGLLFFWYRPLYAQTTNVIPDHKKALRKLEREVRKMAVADKLNPFIVVDLPTTADGPKLVTTDNYRNFTNTDSVIKIINLNTLNELAGLPFPGTQIVGTKLLDIPNWLTGLFDADLLCNLPPDSGILYYGLDSIGTVLSAQPYQDPDSLIRALVKHDLIYFDKLSAELLANGSLKKSDAKLLNKKYLEYRQRPKLLPKVAMPNRDEIRRWVLGLYTNAAISANANSLAADVLRWQTEGAINTNGQLRKLVTGRPQYVGMDALYLDAADTIIQRAIAEKAIPGCQLLVAKDGMVVKNKAYGYLTYDSISPVTNSTLYDLASITKPLATTQAIMMLMESGKIAIDASLSVYLDYLQSTNKSTITIRQILSHQAGLYPYYPFWKRVMDDPNFRNMNHEVQVGSELWVDRAVKDSLIQWVAQSDMLADRVDTITHAQYFYSDLGFYLLLDLIEKQTAMPMDEFLQQNLYTPLGTGLEFNPLKNHNPKQIAPTELDKVLRNELVQGFVHDRNAALMGGVAGHAGLFGTAMDVAILLQMQLNQGRYMDKQYYDSLTVEEFTRRHFAANRRGLGWDMPGNEPDGPVSELASTESFGHTGFTGCSVWADPKENLIFVFLSNRVYPDVSNEKLIEENIRTQIQDLVYQSIIKE